MASSRDEASKNIRAECERLEAAVGNLGSDHCREGALGTALDQSRLAHWISVWLEMVQRDGSGYSDDGIWASAVGRTCRRLLESSGRCGGPSTDVEKVRLFVNDVIKVHVVPCVAFVSQQERTLRGKSGAGRVDASWNGLQGGGRGSCLYSELMGCLESLGVCAARCIAEKNTPPSKGMKKLANTTWAAVYDILQQQDEALRDREVMSRCMDHLGEMIACCVASMGHENSQDGHKALSKALKFLVSNYGRLLMLLGGSVGGADSPTTWQIVSPSICKLWGCLLKAVGLPSKRDPFDGLTLTYRALALSFGHAAEGVDPIPWHALNDGRISAEALQIVARVMINASEKMSTSALERMVSSIEHTMGHMADASIQQEVTESVLADLELGILEYLSRCIETDARVFKRALYAIVGFLLRPHPLVEEVLCRVVIGVMEWGLDDLQYECVALMSDMLNLAVSCDDDLGLSPGIEQGVNVLAAAMMVGGDSVVARVAEERFPLRSDVDCSGSPSSRAGPADVETVDVYAVARLAVFLRAMGCCIWSPAFARNERLQLWLSGHLQKIGKQWRFRPVGDDSDLLMAWTAECLFHASKLVASGPLVDRSVMNGVQTGKVATGDAGKCSAGDVLSVALEQVAGRLILSSSPTSPNLQRAAVLLEQINTNTSLSRRVRIQGLDAALDAFDASLPTAGWLVGLAATRAQRPTSRMRRVYGKSLSTDASLTLQYLAMHSYKEYVSFSDSDEAYGVEAGGDQALDVLPSCRVVSGSMSKDFKSRLVPYLVGLEYGDGSGDGSVDVDAEVRPLLASAVQSLENGFRQCDATKRVHRKVSSGIETSIALDSLRSARNHITKAARALSRDRDASSSISQEIRNVASEIQIELSGILGTSSL